jgi:hypothetical protein
MFVHRDSLTVYSDLDQAFGKVPHTLLLDELNNFGLFSLYIKWFQRYLSPKSSFVRILGNLPLHVLHCREYHKALLCDLCYSMLYQPFKV